MLAAIENRRSIRSYQDRPISREIIEEVLRAGMLAPSSKNRQPWKFIVVSSAAKEEMIAVIKRGIEREKVRPLLPGSAYHISGAEHTVKIMEQAPVTILAVNTLGLKLHRSLSPEERIYENCNAQSIGAAVENMTLAATELGLGSLWICDIYFAYQELQEWIGPEGTLFAALTLGYTNETPDARPRKGMEQAVEWRE